VLGGIRRHDLGRLKRQSVGASEAEPHGGGDGGDGDQVTPLEAPARRDRERIHRGCTGGGNRFADGNGVRLEAHGCGASDSRRWAAQKFLFGQVADPAKRLGFTDFLGAFHNIAPWGITDMRLLLIGNAS
jgi:hypothetical protein